MIKKWLEKIFGKFCKCKEIDEHITMYTKVPEPEIKIVCQNVKNVTTIVIVGKIMIYMQTNMDFALAKAVSVVV